ncbi:MAG: NAD-dependent epimerase/dehydratase family protein [Pyrinomonadaceae bacterium]
MRILVLGGTKFVGPHVVRQLAAHDQGHEITIFHRGATETELPEGVHHVHGDFASFFDHLDELKQLSPEVVLDMVPFREEDADRVKAFAGVARRVVVISSQDVYRAFGRLWRTEPGPPGPVPLTEDSPLREKLSNAGLDYNKTAIETAIKGAVTNDPNLLATIVRLPATHGPGDDKHRLFPYIKRMDDGRSAILLDEAYAGWRWARGYVEDVAHAIVLAVTDERAAGRIYNVAYSETLSEAEWVKAIARVSGVVGAALRGRPVTADVNAHVRTDLSVRPSHPRVTASPRLPVSRSHWPGEVVALPSDQLPPSLRRDMFDFTQQYDVDSSRIRRELDYSEIVPFDEALRRTIEWERANPPEKISPEDFDYAAEDATITARVGKKESIQNLSM